MNCHYCEKEIHNDQEYSRLQNDKANQVILLHYPGCKVAFTTFYKTKKEFELWKANAYKSN